MNQFINRNNKTYKLILNLPEYIKELKKGPIKEIYAQKTSGVLARKTIPGEELIVYTKNGHIEATEICQENYYLLTRADKEGNPVIDKYGHTNTWQVPEEIYLEKYDYESITEKGLVFPKYLPQHLIKLTEDIAIMQPWGVNGTLIPQTIDKGGYLNITKPAFVYGLAEIEYMETYEPLEEIEKDYLEI